MKTDDFECTSDTTLSALLTNHPRLLEALLELGYQASELSAARDRPTNITLGELAARRGIPGADLIGHLTKAHEALHSSPRTMPYDPEADLTLYGYIPCPLAMNLTAALKAFRDDMKERTGERFHHCLVTEGSGPFAFQKFVRSRSLDDAAWPPDVLLAPGLQDVLSDDLIRGLRVNGRLSPVPPRGDPNPLLVEAGMVDDEGIYDLHYAVPAVMICDERRLDGAIPSSWLDLASPRFRDGIAIPPWGLPFTPAVVFMLRHLMGQNDFGRFLANLTCQTHPSKLVQNLRTEERRPAVAIVPHLFTEALKGATGLRVVEPDEGVLGVPGVLCQKSEAHGEAPALIDVLHGDRVVEFLGDVMQFIPNRAGYAHTMAMKKVWFPGWPTLLERNLQQEFHDLGDEVSRAIQHIRTP